MIFGAPIHCQRVTKSCFRNCSTRLSRSKPPLYLCTRHPVSNRAEGSLERLRYILGGDRPSQTTRLTRFPDRITDRVSRPALPGWCSIDVQKYSHLRSTSNAKRQRQGVVKLHGVFPSCYGYCASSRRLQFHRVSRGDSAQVVTPFVRVGTYPTRNFATLGPL